MVGPIYKAVLNNEVIGIIAYGPGLPQLKARSIALPWLLGSSADAGAKMNLLNTIIKRIWRVVVLPKFRSIGLGAKLVKDTMPLVNFPYIETMAVMAHYNPFFEKAGMTKINPELYLDTDENYLKNANILVQMGFDLDLLGSKEYTMKLLASMDSKELEKAKKAIIEGYTSFKHHEQLIPSIQAGDIEAMAEVLAHHPAAYAYLIWRNPNFTDYPEVH